MIESMAEIHMSEAEVAKNFSAALEKVRQGLEVVVEDDQPSPCFVRRLHLAVRSPKCSR
jgi:hypothetical protein